MSKFYVGVCPNPECGSSNLGGEKDPIKHCKDCGQKWIEPIPNSPQVAMLSSNIREIGMGGAAGGAKSASLVLDALGQIDKPHYNAILFRRTFRQLAGADGLIDLSHRFYPHVGGIYNKGEYLWRFKDMPGTIRFAHLEHENTINNYSGHQYAYIGFDELQLFTERQYLFLFSRNRSTNPEVRPYTRSTFNPGGIGHLWIKKRFIDTQITNNPKSFKRIDGVDTEVEPDTPFAVQRVFIPAKLEDNPYLYQDGKGDYEAGLNQLDSVDFARLRHGDWDIKREGMVIYAFDEATTTFDKSKLELDDTFVYYHAHDFGAVNRAWGLFARDEKGVFYLLHAEILPEGTSQFRANLINEKLNGKRVIRGWGGAKSEKQQRLDYQQAGVLIREPIITDFEGGFNALNRMLDNGDLLISSHLYELIDQIENYVRDEDGKPIEQNKQHYADMLRYLAAGEYRPGKVTVKSTAQRARELNGEVQ